MPGANEETSDMAGRSGCRLTKELGMKLVRGTDKVTLGDQDGKEIILKLHFGLPCMEWDDFSSGIRKKLAQSH
eukprot:12919731-Prorocentrum_lima.AAC.1